MPNLKQWCTPRSRATAAPSAGRWLLLILLGAGAAAAVISTADKLLSLWLRSLLSRLGPLHVFVATHVLIIMLTWMLTKTNGSVAARKAVREASVETSRQFMSYIFDPRQNEQWVVRKPSSETLKKAPRPAVTSTTSNLRIRNNLDAPPPVKESESMDAIWKKIKEKSSSSKTAPAILRKSSKVLQDGDLLENEGRLRIERGELEQRRRRLARGYTDKRLTAGIERQATDEFRRRSEAFIEKQRDHLRLERHLSELRQLAAAAAAAAAEGGKPNLN